MRDRTRRLGTALLVVGLAGTCLCLVVFAVWGYVGSRQGIFGGWIAGSWLGFVAFAVLAGWGVVLRHRALRDGD